MVATLEIDVAEMEQNVLATVDSECKSLMLYDGEYFKIKWYEVNLEIESPKERIIQKGADEGEIDLVEMYAEVVDDEFPIDEESEIQDMRFINEN